MIQVSELKLYPFKSARGITVPRVRLGATGFEWDRHWMAIHEDGTFLSQRTHPALARIGTEITAANLILTSAHREPLSLPLHAAGSKREVRVWQDTCVGLDQGDEAAAWVSAILDDAVRVVRAPASPQRPANPKFAGPEPAPLAFPDGFPVLICNRASLDELNSRMPEALPMERFRANLVLEGLAPFAEDRIASISVGAIQLALVKPCTRCIIPSTDQRTGVRGFDPVSVLRTFRFDHALRGVCFGENAVIRAGIGEVLECGAPCEIAYDRA
jgi:uncharacterized protein YcbX